MLCENVVDSLLSCAQAKKKKRKKKDAGDNKMSYVIYELAKELKLFLY